MADDASMTESGETFTREYVDKLKADLASKAEETAKLKAFKNTHDEKQRAVISQLQPEIQGFIETIAKDNVDYAQDIKPLVDWSRSCHESQSLETAMPLARVISCASAQFKRTREEASVLTEKANTLSTAMKELEDLKAADSAKTQRIAELETLANERQDANTKLQEELAKAGVIKDKFDFSKLASREAFASKDGDENLKKASDDALLTTVTSNASRGNAVPMEDELMSFVRGVSNGNSSSKIVHSGTNHSFLGASQLGFESEIANAIRGF